MESATIDVAIFVIPLACISSRDDYKALLICECKGRKDNQGGGGIGGIETRCKACSALLCKPEATSVSEDKVLSVTRT